MKDVVSYCRVQEHKGAPKGDLVMAFQYLQIWQERMRRPLIRDFGEQITQTWAVTPNIFNVIQNPDSSGIKEKSIPIQQVVFISREFLSKFE